MKRTSHGLKAAIGAIAAFAAIFAGVPAAAADAPGPTPAVTNPPTSVAVLGDSISVATGINWIPSVTSPNHSWATGTNARVNSVYTRMQALNPSVTRHNQASNGRRMNDMANQAGSMPVNARLVLVQLGGNDLCRDTVEQMPSVEQYRTWFHQGLDAIEARAPNAITMVSSVPDIWNLWFLRGAPNPPNPQPSSRAGTARLFWDTLSVIPCRSLVTRPTSMEPADIDRREAVRQRNIEYNLALAEECAERIRCRTDNMLTFNFSSNRSDPPFGDYLPPAQWEFVDNDISSVDHFHPSASGQTKLARASWETGYNYAESQPPATGDAEVIPAPNRNGVNYVAPEVAVTYTDLDGVRGIEYRIHHHGQVTDWVESAAAPGTSGEAWEFEAAHTVTIPVEQQGVSWVETRAMDANGNLSASRSTRVEYDPSPPVSLEAPALTGQAFAGRKLTCEAGSWNGAVNQVIAVWTRDGEVFENLAENGRTTRRAYVTQPDDIGARIACHEVGLNPLGETTSGPSNSIQVIDVVPVVERAPVLTTSNATGNQVVASWPVGWQLRGVVGEYSNPTGNPWIGRQRYFAQAADPIGESVPVTGPENRAQYVTRSSDLGQAIVFVEVATNIFGSNVGVSNATGIVSG